MSYSPNGEIIGCVHELVKPGTSIVPEGVEISREFLYAMIDIATTAANSKVQRGTVQSFETIEGIVPVSIATDAEMELGGLVIMTLPSISSMKARAIVYQVSRKYKRFINRMKNSSHVRAGYTDGAPVFYTNQK